MPSRSPRNIPISFLLLASAFALPTVVLGAGCEPVRRSSPAAATTAAGKPSWSQLDAYLNSYYCTSLTQSCTGTDAFILADKTGPATPLYALSKGIIPQLNNPQLLGSAAKMPAAAAILSALYKSPQHYTIHTNVATILLDYVKAHPEDKKAGAFKKAWHDLEEALSTGTTVRIKVGQLLSMTSGFSTLWPDPNDPLKPHDPQPACMSDSIDKKDPDPYTAGTLADCAIEIATVIKSPNEPPKAAFVMFPPGTKYGYSAVSYQVAGYLATLVAGYAGPDNGYGGDWVRFFDDTFAAPLGLSKLRYNNDLHLHSVAPSPVGTVVTNPRVAGGASGTAQDYSTILTMILNGGGQVVSPDVVTLLETNQLPDAWWAQPKTSTQSADPDQGMDPNVLYYAPLDPQFFRGYSFGLFIPTSGTAASPRFFTTLASQTSPHGNTPQQQDLTPPHKKGTIFMDPGLYGTIAWFDIDPASTFSAVNVIFQYPGDLGRVGLDMMRTADSAISCQFEHPGVQPYPTAAGGYHPPFCLASPPPAP